MPRISERELVTLLLCPFVAQLLHILDILFKKGNNGHFFGSHLQEQAVIDQCMQFAQKVYITLAYRGRSRTARHPHLVHLPAILPFVDGIPVARNVRSVGYDPFHTGAYQVWDDKHFLFHFRMTRAKFDVIVDMVRHHLPPSKYHPCTRVALFLKKLAHSEVDRTCGIMFGVPEGSFNVIFHSVMEAMWDHFVEANIPPLSADRIRYGMRAWKDAGLPAGLFGVIDGIQIRFIRHGGEKRLNFGYKHRFIVLNSLGVALPNLEFLWFSAGFPGSMNDQGMWNDSGLGYGMTVEGAPLWDIIRACGPINAPGRAQYTIDKPFLFGDGGFALRPWMINPYRGELQPGQREFNKWFSGHRATVERAFGNLVGRWGILRKGGIIMSAERASRVIMMCVALHNYCQRERMPMPPVDEEDLRWNQAPHAVAGHDGRQGVAMNPRSPYDQGKIFRNQLYDWWRVNVEEV